jgi:D-lyxose ketol-isomerase
MAEMSKAVRDSGAKTVRKNAKRKPAGALGVTHLSPDFDAPLPPEIQHSFDGQGGIHDLVGKVHWSGDLDESRKGRDTE